MHCSHCGRRAGDTRPPCPHCADATLPVATPTTNDHTGTNTVDPEVLGPDSEESERITVHTAFGGGNGGGNGGGQFGQFRYYSWGQSGGSAFNAGCLPFFITCGLFLGCAFNMGLLAAIGFGFFYLLGSMFAATASARRLMSGQPLTPTTQWINRILVWGVALLITTALAGNM